MDRAHLLAEHPALPTVQEACDMWSAAGSVFDDAASGDLVFPCWPDRLLAQLPARDEPARRQASLLVYQFAQTFARMSVAEQVIVFRYFLYGVYDDLAEQIQIEWSYLRRLSGLTPTDLQHHLGSLSTLGFECILREPDALLRLCGQGSHLILQWHAVGEEGMVNATAIAVLTMRTLIADRSEEAALILLQRLDFSSLAAGSAEEQRAHGDY